MTKLILIRNQKRKTKSYTNADKAIYVSEASLYSCYRSKAPHAETNHCLGVLGSFAIYKKYGSYMSDKDAEQKLNNASGESRLHF